MKCILKKIFKQNKDEEKIKKVNIEAIFKRTHDIDKFIDEYRELIIWINDKYPSFRYNIKNYYWIERIIRDHDEILIDLRKMIKGETKTSEYLHNKEKINEILNSNIKNTTYIFPKAQDPFFYNVGLLYLKKFIKKYPNKSNFLDEAIINDIISTDNDTTIYNLKVYKEPFMYVEKGVSMIDFEFKKYKNISDDNELDINELINFAEELVRAM